MIFLELIHVYEIDFVFLSLRLFFNTIPGKFENIIATTSTGAIQLVRTHRKGREGSSIPMRTHVKRCVQEGVGV